MNKLLGTVAVAGLIAAAPLGMALAGDAESITMDDTHYSSLVEDITDEDIMASDDVAGDDEGIMEQGSADDDFVDDNDFSAAIDDEDTGGESGLVDDNADEESAE